LIQRIARRGAAFALAAVLSVAAFAATAPSALAATGHACTVVTNPADTVGEGVFCADVSNSTNGGTVDVTFGAEGVCQTQVGSDNEQCSNETLSFGLFSPAGELYEVDNESCGHSNGPCPTPRFLPSRTLGIGLSACVQVWTVVFAGSTIVLPGSGKPVTLSANLGSGHITICP
jgi:hypothetical protein